MRIRKKYRTEGPAHVVRNCSTDRCSKSLHGHTYHWELILKGDKLDDAGMLMDFGLLGGEIKQFFDAFDHAHMMWNREEEYEFFKNFSERFIGVPFSPSAENMAIMAFKAIQGILNRTVLQNGEGFVSVDKVIVHETETGWAEAGYEDLQLHDYYDLNQIHFNHFPEWEKFCYSGSYFVKPKPVHQIDVSKGLFEQCQNDEEAPF